METLEIIKGRNVIINKSYLQRFYTVKKPSWVKFCEKLLNKNFFVVLYIPVIKTLSKYLIIIKNSKIMRLRYSDHAPLLSSWLNGSIDLYIGSSQKGMLNEKEAMKLIEFYFRN